MWGIVTLMDYAGAGIDQEELLRIRDAMAARGPDGSGVWISSDAKVGLPHRRRSLLDLSDAGAQPMANADGSLRIVFNGEIYNYRELRRDLEEYGFVFRSGSDTEVLLHLYAYKGEPMLDVLRGMYAFVIWDERRKCVFAARDPFGIKPLYIGDDGHCIRIASQVKALLAGGRIDTAHEPAGQVGFLLWGYVPEPFTLYKSITSFPAAACITVDANGARSIRYFCRISTALTGLAAEESPLSLRSITLGFNEDRGTGSDETAYAGLVPQRYQTDHHTRWFCRDEFDAEVPHIVSAMDQPSIDGINTYFVSKAARACGAKTALSGLGGDELFGTYPSFKDVPRMVRLFGGNPLAAAGCAVRRLTSPLLGRIASARYTGLLEYGGTFAGVYLLRRGLFMPWEMTRILPSETVREGWEGPAPPERLTQTVAGIKSDRLKVSALEMTWYMRNQLLRDSDWAGMAHSVEIRLPMVDIKVLRALAPLLANRPMHGKRVLGEVPAKRLPDALLERPKTGFAVPVHEWVSPPQPGAPRRSLSMALRNWALRLAREFDLAA